MKDAPITFAKLAPVLVLAAMLSACAGGARSAKDPEAALRERANQRWEFLIAKDAAKAWEYLSPGYRQTKTQEEYAVAMNDRPVKWLASKVQEVQCSDPDVCDVVMSVEIEVPSPIGGMEMIRTWAPVRERWLQTQGRWYFLPKEALQ